MPNNCGKISASILLNCDYPLVGGVEDRLVLMNRADIASVTRNTSNTQILEAMALTSSPRAYAYEYEGKNNSIDAKSELVKKKYAEGYKHEIVFRIFTNSPDVKKQIEQLARGEVVAVLENNFRAATGNAAFEVYGIDVGLHLTVMETNKSDAETQGAYILTLSTMEDQIEPHLPATLFITSYAASKAVVDGLLN